MLLGSPFQQYNALILAGLATLMTWLSKALCIREIPLQEEIKIVIPRDSTYTGSPITFISAGPFIMKQLKADIDKKDIF